MNNLLWARHEPWIPDAYPLNAHTLRVTLYTQQDLAKAVRVYYGDRYGKRSYRMALAKVGQNASEDIFQASLPLHTGRFQYLFEIITDELQSWTFGADGLGQDVDHDEPFQYAYIQPNEWSSDDVSWVNQAICYQIFPDRFSRHLGATRPSHVTLSPWSSEPTPTSFFGGTLKGIEEKIEYLADLGVNVIYLTPIFLSPSNHRYDIVDYFRIDPLLGTMADLQALVQKLHQRHMKLILDAVFNHTSREFFAFQDIVRNGPNSRFWDWYFVHGFPVEGNPPNYETFGTQIATMPKLNVSHPEVQQYLLNVGRYWIEQADIDGWRLDVANEVDHDFWRRFRQEMKSLKPGALIIGEVWHDATPWLGGDQFDGTMNYPWRHILLDYFVEQRRSVSELAHHLDRWQWKYTDKATRASWNLLGTHDTPRILTLLKEDLSRLKLLFLIQMTWIGIPMIYYGDEWGMTGEGDPLCRGGMNWEAPNPAFFDFIQRLIYLRQHYRALSAGDLHIHHEWTSHDILEYERRAGVQTVRVTINLGQQAWTLPSNRHTLLSTGDKTLTQLPPGQAEIWILP
ncbi:glycoside hydrolase family 13 protein [Sulfobacillus thermosulfidooxidans]|uniref:glycoside hydrolase family 13 protein n=1 Tax=Sulfobacillus thermosulfidooxidans TaxID=28034 RepID=UPI0006B62453|nr:glycoside hydrolase family 13 protein [Sulfobacillus thermosulfidooxidans]